MLFEHKVDMQIDKDRTALVLVDIQNDFLTDGGKYYVMIEELMKRNDVNARLETLLKTCKFHNFPVFMSPHYFFPHDHKGKTGLGPMEDLALSKGRSDAGIDDLPHIRLAAQKQRPVHEGFHVAIDGNVFGEIGEEEGAAGFEHIEASLRQLDCHLIRQIIIKTCGVDEVELSKIVGAGKKIFDRTVDSFDACAGKVARNGADA